MLSATHSARLRRRLSGIHGCHIFGYQAGWRGESLADVGDICYGQLERSGHGEDDCDLLIVPDLLSGSDYSGDSVTASNYRVFIEQFGELPGVHRLYGGHGTYGVAIEPSAYFRSSDMQDALRQLDRYPVLDDEDMSMLESEWEDEAWSNWAESDFRRAVEKRFDCELVSDIRPWFEQCRESANEYWVSENSGMWINLDRIVESIQEVPSELIEAQE